MSEPARAGPTFEAIAAEYGAALLRVARAYAADDADAQDLYQEICYAIWRALPRFRGESAVRTFVWRIAHNRGLTYRVRRSATRQHEMLNEAGEVPDPAPTPEQVVSQAIEREHLLAAIRALSPALRDVVLLSLEGLRNHEIADVLGVTENAVGVRLNRAKHALRQRLEARQHEPA